MLIADELQEVSIINLEYVTSVRVSIDEILFNRYGKYLILYSYESARRDFWKYHDEEELNEVIRLIIETDKENINNIRKKLNTWNEIKDRKTY